MFLIKDALEYAGVIIDKKPNQTRIYKNMVFKQKKESEKLEKLKVLLEKAS